MRALNYFKNRFQYALNATGKITINQNDIDALNQIIEFVNGKQNNENLEDSLLLFWIFSKWKVELEQNVLRYKEDGRGYLKITSIYNAFNELALLLDPKEKIINEITIELQAAQRKLNMNEETIIPEDKVRELLEEGLKSVKNNFKPISTLKKYSKIVTDYAK